MSRTSARQTGAGPARPPRPAPPATEDRWLLRGGTLVPIEGPPRAGDLLVQDGRIAALGPGLRAPPGTPVLDASGCLVLPGLVQAHVHLCQTLCRGQADDLPLLRWLRERVWPYEAALDEAALRVAAQVSVAELLLSGTTAILDMGTVHGQDALIDAIAATGLRATVGKAMMDRGEGVPRGLREGTRASLSESDALCERWHGAAEGRIRYAYAPRFVLTCSDAVLRGVSERVADKGEDGPRLHTHAAEQRDEVALVRARLGADNIRGLAAFGISGPRTVLAHCVHVDGPQRRHLARAGTHVTHCPSSNMKLGSGLAPVTELLAAGVNVALGADGAPCNNNLDGFMELRLAALLQKGRLGPAALPAARALELATLGGARALGLEREIGSLRVGKRADVIIVEPRALHAAPPADPAGMLVYALRSSDVRDVLVDGRLLVRGRALTAATGLDREALLHAAAEHGARVRRRAGLA